MMPLRWRFETWRKLYVREEGTFAALPLTARMLAAELLKICDDEGVIHLGGRDPVAVVSIRLAANRWERRALVPNALEALLADGYLVREPERLLIRNFVPAQTGVDRVPIGPAGGSGPGPGVAAQRRDSGGIEAAQRRDSGGIEAAQPTHVPETARGPDRAPFRILPSVPSLRKHMPRKERAAGAGSKKSHPDRQAFVGRFHALYLAAYGCSPTWGTVQMGMVSQLLRKHPLAECVRRAEILFSAPPRFLVDTPCDLGTLVGNFDKLATASAPGSLRLATGSSSPVGHHATDPREVANLVKLEAEAEAAGQPSPWANDPRRWAMAVDWHGNPVKRIDPPGSAGAGAAR